MGTKKGVSRKDKRVSRKDDNQNNLRRPVILALLVVVVVLGLLSMVGFAFVGIFSDDENSIEYRAPASNTQILTQDDVDLPQTVGEKETRKQNQQTQEEEEEE